MNFLKDNLKNDNDIIVTFNIAAYAKPESGVNFTHSCVFDSIAAKNKNINKIFICLGECYHKLFSFEQKCI